MSNNNNSNLTLNVQPTICPFCKGSGAIGYGMCLACGGSGLAIPATTQPTVTANANFDPDDGLELPVMNWRDDEPKPESKPTNNAPVSCGCDDDDGLPLPVMKW